MRYDEGDEPRPRRKLASPRRRRIPLWAIALMAACPVVVVIGAVAMCAGTWYYLATTSPQALIIGSWQATAPVPGVVVEFHREGTMIVRQNGAQASARYRFLDDKLLEFDLPNQARPMQGMLPQLGAFKQAGPEKVNVTILTLTQSELVIRTKDVVQRFKRDG
jgi:hypothetical protein